ncbi:hypothetical protein [Nocardia wallacei]|uniref:hypothetical protein n=1 Tax=Nocardia wallacei TaxID=480035 RepID=UPI00245617BE|nr:hypothetical protein [Nocardia wallacei]
MSTYDNLGDGEMVLAKLPAETERAASLVVAGVAADADECRMLLAMLGLPVRLPDPEPEPEELIDAEPARAVVNRHRAAGRSLREIAEAAGVHKTTVHKLVYGNGKTLPMRITRTISAAIMAARLEPGNEPVDPRPTRASRICEKCSEWFTPRPADATRCQACKVGLPHARHAREHLTMLGRLGATWTQLAPVCGLTPKTLAQIANGKQTHLSAANEQAILALSPVGTAVPTR